MQVAVVGGCLLAQYFYDIRWWIAAAVLAVGVSIYYRLGVLTWRYSRLGRKLLKSLDEMVQSLPEKIAQENQSDDHCLVEFSRALDKGCFSYAHVVRDGELMVDLLGREREPDCVRYLLRLIGTGEDTYLEIGIRRALCRDYGLAALVAPYISHLQLALGKLESDNQLADAKVDVQALVQRVLTLLDHK